MGLGDCPKCWSAVCCCGYEYRYMTRKRRINQAAAVLGVDEEVVQSLGTRIPVKHPQDERG